MIFELVVVDTKEQAESYNATNTESHQTYVTYVGEGLCGLHYRGQRPNKLTRLHSPMINDFEKRWEKEIILSAMAREWRNG